MEYLLKIYVIGSLIEVTEAARGAISPFVRRKNTSVL